MKNLSFVWRVVVIALVVCLVVCLVAALIGFVTAKILSKNVEEIVDTDNSTSETWKTITIGGVVSFEIPVACMLDPGAGTSYLVCPTDENPTPTPEMTFSSDGTTVNVRRWEGLDSPYWEHIISSMTVIQPMERDITINIEK